MPANLNIMYDTLRGLREELEEFMDVVDGDDGEPAPNDAMRIATEIDEVLGDTPYLSRSMNVARLDACIDDALDFLNHALEVKHGYRSA